MTGKEILEEEFEKAGMRGYKADQVDNFLRQIAAFVDEQEVEKNDLIYKIKILADRIEEYKADEGNIRDALLGAQKLGASIVNEAKAKAEAITKEARTSSDEMMAQAKAKSESYAREALQKTNMDLADMKREGEKERINLDKMKREISAFKVSILKQYKSHLDMLSNLPSVSDEQRTEIKVEVPAPESIPVVKVSMFDQDSDSFEKIERAPKEKDIPDVQTISSEILTNTKELEDEELEQTKEFSNNDKTAKPADEPASESIEEALETEQEEAPIDFGSFGNKRPNYIEKFGELKFGGFGKNNE